MNYLYIFIFPSFVGLSIYKNLLKESSLADLLIKYGAINIITNSLILFFWRIYTGFDQNVIEFLENRSYYSTLYVFIAIILSSVLGVIYAVFTKSLRISLEKEEIKDEERPKKKNANKKDN